MQVSLLNVEERLRRSSGRTVTVIDASAVVAFLLREEGWETVDSVLRERPSSPELLPVECGNAILVARRRRRLSPERAATALDSLGRVTENVVRLHGHGPLLHEAYSVADSSGLSIYDSMYLALCLRERAPLLSRDNAQGETARRLGIRTLPF